MATRKVSLEPTEQEQQEIDATDRNGKRALELLRRAYDDETGCELTDEQLRACVELGFIRLL